mmetsp:Transcript_19077/g.62315  ORF Transcript_19077/g.62315 Transcript_19077/m.62315 type:complete len:272 (+) Transcript_19077:842-1657(+)
MLGLRVVLKHGSDPAAASAPRCAGDAIPLATQGIANGSRVSRELRLLLRTAGARRARPFKRPAVGAVTLAAEHPPALSHATCRARRGTHPGRLFTQELRCRNRDEPIEQARSEWERPRHVGLDHLRPRATCDTQHLERQVQAEDARAQAAQGSHRESRPAAQVKNKRSLQRIQARQLKASEGERGLRSFKPLRVRIAARRVVILVDALRIGAEACLAPPPSDRLTQIRDTVEHAGGAQGRINGVDTLWRQRDGTTAAGCSASKCCNEGPGI